MNRISTPFTALVIVFISPFLLVLTTEVFMPPDWNHQWWALPVALFIYLFLIASIIVAQRMALKPQKKVVTKTRPRRF